MKKKTIIDYLTNHKSNFENKYNIQKIGLFGSFARNEQNENSDIDLVYVLKKETTITYFELYNLQKNMEIFFKRKIELINYKYMNPIIKYKSEKDIIYV